MISSALIRWYRRNRRDLPWRVAEGYPQAYRVLVSELMLQQTQVATVIPYFHRFMARFPTIADLALADEQELLRLWQGLGYYSRARNLQKCAQAILRDHGGIIPQDLDQLISLPGIGHYTAGAIASLAYGRRTPILDGNVQRVLSRVDALTADPSEPAIRAALWARAEQLLPQRNVAEFNSALMDLGATICTPRNPKCPLCPIRAHCAASAQGIQEEIPRPRKAIRRPIERRWVLCIEHQGHWLIEQRPTTGRWAGMWQFVTVVRGKGRPNVAALTAVPITHQRKIGDVRHDLTHRRYEFTAFACTAATRTPPSATRQWVTPAQLHQHPLPRPHLQIANLLHLEGW